MDAFLTRDQVRLLDRLATEQYAMPTLILMENAGRSAATIIHERFGGAGRAWVCCGVGNNGGDGCVLARHLHNAGWSVRGMMAGDQLRMAPDTQANHRILQAMGLDVPIAEDEEVQRTMLSTVRTDDLLVDALLGTGFRGQVRSPLAELIQAMNAATKRAMVAVDLPSGLDCDSGTPSNAAIRADLTITFVAPKAGFSSPDATPYLGRVEVADIGAPRQLVQKVIAKTT